MSKVRLNSSRRRCRSPCHVSLSLKEVLRTIHKQLPLMSFIHVHALVESVDLLEAISQSLKAAAHSEGQTFQAVAGPFVARSR